MPEKFCFGCRKVKDLSKFSLKPSGRPEEQCMMCMETFNAPKKQPKGYPSDKPGKLAGLNHDYDCGPVKPVRKVRKKKVHRHPDRIIKAPFKPPKDYKGYTDEDYMEKVIGPFVKEFGDGFKTIPFRRYWSRSRSWTYRIMSRLEAAGFLVVHRGIANRDNTYYLTDKGYDFLGLTREDTEVYVEFVDV